MQSNRRRLYFLILVLGSAILVTALGGGLFNQSAPWYFQWQHQAFLQLCHQAPERSFWINGQPMAVCSRCLGIYGGFLIGWMVLPVESKWGITANIAVNKIALGALLLNLFDVGGNMLGVWQNTLVSRLLLGSLLGTVTAFLFNGIFFNRTIKSTEHHHGRITAADL